MSKEIKVGIFSPNDPRPWVREDNIDLDEVIINLWPCNHLGFAYTDLTPQLAEMAHRLNIGYRIFDAKGKEYFKPT